MQQSPDSTPPNVARTVAFGAAMTCGVLASLAAYIVLGDLGLDLASAWRAPSPAAHGALASALAWWLIAGCGFLGSAVAVEVMRAAATGSRPGRLLLWSSAAGFVCTLAAVSHASVGAAGIGAATRAAAGMAALLVGGFMAVCGTRFALQRPARTPAAVPRQVASERRRLPIRTSREPTRANAEEASTETLGAGA